MTQKEFLKTFLEALGLMDNHLKLYADEDIDKFLEQHHKEYFEVEHIRKDASEEECSEAITDMILKMGREQ